jgi:hypothetical protein
MRIPATTHFFRFVPLLIIGLLSTITLGCDLSQIIAPDEDPKSGSSSADIVSAELRTTDNPTLLSDVQGVISGSTIYVALPYDNYVDSQPLYMRTTTNNEGIVHPSGPYSFSSGPIELTLASEVGIPIKTYQVVTSINSSGLNYISVADPFVYDLGTGTKTPLTALDIVKSGNTITLQLGASDYDSLPPNALIGYDTIYVPPGATADTSLLQVGWQMPYSAEVTTASGTESYTFAVERRQSDVLGIYQVTANVYGVYDGSERTVYTTSRATLDSDLNREREVEIGYSLSSDRTTVRSTGPWSSITDAYGSQSGGSRSSHSMGDGVSRDEVLDTGVDQKIDATTTRNSNLTWREEANTNIAFLRSLTGTSSTAANTFVTHRSIGDITTTVPQEIVIGITSFNSASYAGGSQRYSPSDGSVSRTIRMQNTSSGTDDGKTFRIGATYTGSASVSYQMNHDLAPRSYYRFDTIEIELMNYTILDSVVPNPAFVQSASQNGNVITLTMIPTNARIAGVMATVNIRSESGLTDTIEIIIN